MQPEYLPDPVVPEDEYERLCEDNSEDYDLDLEEPAIPIQPRMTEQQVYSLLPSATSFEYGGIIERNSIRYQKCDTTMAWTNHSSDCTWHSHPTGSSSCDQPSPMDVRSFLVNRNLRAVTVGRDIVWVFDKQPETSPFIKRLIEWERVNLVPRMLHWMASPHSIQHYCSEALSILGVTPWLKKHPTCDDWAPTIESLGVKVRIFRR